jgi:sulfur relay (sulfurtransferase) DsrC/TusE family protein
MIPEITYYPVNWVDGMKISRRHFTETERFTTDHLRDAMALQLRPDNYGLLPATNELGSPAAFELLLSVDAQGEVQARLTQCRAITAGGTRIEITASSTPLTARTSLAQLLAAFSLTATEGLRFSVVLTANPFERVPTGTPAPEEIPPRHPYSRPAYELSFVPTQQLSSATSGAFTLVVGELLYADGELRPVAQFIPPSTALASHASLLQALHQLDFQLTELETDAFKIIHKVKLRTDKSSHLADMVRDLSERTVFALAQQLTTLRLMAAAQPPIYLLDVLLRIAKQVKTSLDSLTEGEREELLKYFEQWSETLPATLLGALQNAVTLTYNHHQVHEHLRQQQQLWQLIGAIFRQLSQLEYIGKNKEGWQSFINENPVAPKPLSVPGPEPQGNGPARWNPFTT